MSLLAKRAFMSLLSQFALIFLKSALSARMLSSKLIFQSTRFHCFIIEEAAANMTHRFGIIVRNGNKSKF